MTSGVSETSTSGSAASPAKIENKEVSESTSIEKVEDSGKVQGEKKKEPKTKSPQKCEVKSYEARFESSGKREMKAIDAKADTSDDDKDKKREYALCSYKWYKNTGEVERESVEIMSPHIILALQKTIGEYPGEHFWADTVTIDSPYRPVFHYRKELAAYAATVESQEAKAHIELMLSFHQKECETEVAEYDANVLNAVERPSIRYTNMWMAYKPGSLVFMSNCAGLKCMEIVDSEERKGEDPAYLVKVKAFTHDGKNFGYKKDSIEQSPYKGVKELSKLICTPHDYFEASETRETTKKILIERGWKFVALKGSHYRAYAGQVTALSDVRDWRHWGKYQEEPMIISSRIVVDCKMFGVMKSPNRVFFRETKSMPKDCKPEEEQEYITERDLLLADSRVPGYALQQKRWCWFHVDKIEPVVFNKDAFASLLIPDSQKSLVHSLVKTHVGKTDEFDDMIAGKGKGLVFVLHGCPGVGKTFTAESVADHIERPLYILNSGELGIKPKEVEENLNKALMLAVAWNAILLIDEADVFLEQRSVQDLQRNCLVSLFLRVLEYYEGILFLTTNRITTFDPAFKSRVHLALKYNALSAAARKKLYVNFVKRTSRDAPVLGEEVLNRLAAVDINGRQIKNAVRTASALAREEGVKLNEEHLQAVLETTAQFEEDLADTEE